MTFKDAIFFISLLHTPSLDGKLVERGSQIDLPVANNGLNGFIIKDGLLFKLRYTCRSTHV